MVFIENKMTIKVDKTDFSQINVQKKQENENGKR